MMNTSSQIKQIKVHTELLLYLLNRQIDKYSGYPLTKHTIRPFADDELTNDRDVAQIHHRWNYDLSHLLIRVEHTFGQLKGYSLHSDASLAMT